MRGVFDGRLVARWLTTVACPSFSSPLWVVQFSVLLPDSQIAFFPPSSLPYPVLILCHLLWNKDFPERGENVLRYLCPIEWFSKSYWTKTLSIQPTKRTIYFSTIKHQTLVVTVCLLFANVVIIYSLYPTGYSFCVHYCHQKMTQSQYFVLFYFLNLWSILKY